MHPKFETNSDTASLQYQIMQLGGRLCPVTGKQIQIVSGVASLILKHLIQLKTLKESLVSHLDAHTGL